MKRGERIDGDMGIGNGNRVYGEEGTAKFIIASIRN